MDIDPCLAMIEPHVALVKRNSPNEGFKTDTLRIHLQVHRINIKHYDDLKMAMQFSTPPSAFTRRQTPNGILVFVEYNIFERLHLQSSTLPKINSTSCR